MSVLSPVRAEEVLAGWRRGLELDGLESPAGPLFSDGYAESEITMTGSGPSLNTFEIISCAIPEQHHGQCAC